MILLAALGGVGLMLWVFGLSAIAIASVLLILLIAAGVAGLWDYLSKRRFYTDLKKALQADIEAYYLGELLNSPSFPEGQLSFQAIELASKDMNDRIAQYRIAGDEYREYIESWIHEVKTPIASSRLALSNLDSSETSEKGTLKSLENDLDRIDAYVEQALYYARSTAVERDYAIKAINLDTLIKAAVKKHSRQLIEAGITPQFIETDIKVYSDAKWLDFILGQIIANAIKYARPRSETHTPTLIFSTQKEGSGQESAQVILRIEDNGIGIPSTDIARIFDKGFTGINGRTYAKSTGIGLYLCKKLCNKMRLSLSADSVEGQSTTLSLTFSLSKMYFLE